MRPKILNKTFWRFLMGFLVVIALSLFMVILIGTFADLAADEAEKPEDCFLFC
jgi:predicted membrane protein